MKENSSSLDHDHEPAHASVHEVVRELVHDVMSSYADDELRQDIRSLRSIVHEAMRSRVHDVTRSHTGYADQCYRLTLCARLGRSIRHLIDQLSDLQDRGIEFRSLQENIDTTSPGGRLVFHIFASLAEFERDLIRERTNAGLAAARARGRVGGRPPSLTGDKLATAKKLYDQQDMTVAQIGDILGVSRSTIYRALRREPDFRPIQQRPVRGQSDQKQHL
ncbi:recombinase family protein [Micrococcaceae sp. AOP34-BR2-30]